MDDRLSTRDLLDAWRDANRAAEHAERLAEAATKAAEVAEETAGAAEEIATLAEAAAAASEHAAAAARTAATKARSIATESRDMDLRDAAGVAEVARAAASAAHDRYKRAVGEAEVRHNGHPSVPPRADAGAGRQAPMTRGETAHRDAGRTDIASGDIA